MTAESHLMVERRGHVLELTMNRPEARNAFSTEMLVRMSDAWLLLDEDPDLRVAILTGGHGTFCAGADLRAMAGGHQENSWSVRVKADPEIPWRAMLRHHRPRKPVVAAVEGFCIAGGMEILQGTDIRIAAQGAKIGLAEVRWGLFPLGGSTVRLRRQIPYTLAAEMLLTGRPISAADALRYGLIGRVVADGDALTEARKVAEIIAENGPIAVQAVLRSLRETEGLSEVEGLKVELEIGQPVFKTEDAKEGPRAFLEKRKPSFRGA